MTEKKLKPQEKPHYVNNKDFSLAVVDYCQVAEKAKKQKSKGGGSDLEEFMALEQIKEKEEELKKMMIYIGRPGLWQDWQEFQAEARKSRRYQEKMRAKRQAELMEYMGYGIAFIFVLFFGGLLAWIVGKWTGKF